MKTVSIRDAKNCLTELGREVEAGETIVVTRNGRPIFDLVPYGLIPYVRDAPTHCGDFIPSCGCIQRFPPHYVIPAKAGTQVIYPLGIAEFLQIPSPVCGKTARAVRRAGWAQAHPDPYRSGGLACPPSLAQKSPAGNRHLAKLSPARKVRRRSIADRAIRETKWGGGHGIECAISVP